MQMKGIGRRCGFGGMYGTKRSENEGTKRDQASGTILSAFKYAKRQPLVWRRWKFTHVSLDVPQRITLPFLDVPFQGESAGFLSAVHPLWASLVCCDHVCGHGR